MEVGKKVLNWFFKNIKFGVGLKMGYNFTAGVTNLQGLLIFFFNSLVYSNKISGRKIDFHYTQLRPSVQIVIEHNILPIINRVRVNTKIPSSDK